MILHKKTILNNISKADCHENVLSSEDIEKVWQTAFLGGNVRKNSLGNVFISGDVVKRAYEIIKHKILVKGEMYGGNYFIACHPYGPHMDSFAEKDVVDDGTTVYKNVIIPLWIGGSNFGDHIVFYDQRLVDYGSAFGGKSEYNNERKHKLHADYSNLQFYNGNGEEMDKSAKFSVEDNIEWKPGNVIVFDSVQVHSSTRTEWTNKMGLLLKFKTRLTS
jgi:hypothetical protein|tara:strand:+ start:18133 stop:18789 length:657 start_codon:yes stop_codon:yes gene_type:complete